MAIDVQSEIRIDRPRAEVAAWAADPDNAPRWRRDITAVEWRSQPPLRTGARVAFTHPALGLPLSYRYQVVEHEPGERTVLRTDEGPFPIETTLEWADADGGATAMTLRIHGGHTGSKAAARVLARTMERTARKDLARLKRILEARDEEG